MIRKTVQISADLRQLLETAWTVVDSDEDDGFVAPSDAIQTGHGYAGLVDGDSDRLSFAFFPEGGSERWEFELSKAQLQPAAAGQWSSIEVNASEIEDPRPSSAPTRRAAGAASPAKGRDDTHARRLLELLVEHGSIELEQDQPPPELAAATADILAATRSASAQAAKLEELFMSNDAVAEVFIDPDELGELLKRW